MLIGLSDDPESTGDAWESQEASAWTPEATAAIGPSTADKVGSFFATLFPPAAAPVGPGRPPAPAKQILGLSPMVAYTLGGLALAGIGYAVWKR